MKFSGSILSLLWLFISIGVQAQSDLKERIDAVRLEIDLTDKKLDKLESIRTNSEWDELKRDDKWFETWEKFDPEARMGSIDLYAWLNSDDSSSFRGVPATSTEYLTLKTHELMEAEMISDKELKFLSNALMVFNPHGFRMEVRKDIENIVELFKAQDEYALSTDEIRSIGSFFRKYKYKEHKSLASIIELIQNPDESFKKEFGEHMLSHDIHYYKLRFPHVSGGIESDTENIAGLYGHEQMSIPGNELYDFCTDLLSIYWWHPKYEKVDLLAQFEDWKPSDYEKYKALTWRGDVKDAIVAHIMMQQWGKYQEEEFNTSTAGVELAKVFEMNAWEMMCDIESELMVRSIYSDAIEYYEDEMNVFYLYEQMHSGVYYYPSLDADMLDKVANFDFDLFKLSEPEALLISKIQPNYTRSLKDETPPRGFSKSNLEVMRFRFALYLSHINAAYASNTGVYYSDDYEPEDVDELLTYVNREFITRYEKIIDSAYANCYQELDALLNSPKERVIVAFGQLGASVTGDVSDSTRRQISVYLQNNFPLSSSGIKYVRFVFGDGAEKPLFIGPYRDSDEPEMEVVSFPVSVPPAPMDDDTPEVEEEIIDFPEKEAQFPTGNSGLKEWLQDNLVYPEIAEAEGIEGRVYLTFVIEQDGGVSNVKVNRGVRPDIDREAKRLLRKMPKWIPAEQNGRKVRSRSRVSIDFSLK